jgi:hypothetical protein
MDGVGCYMMHNAHMLIPKPLWDEAKRIAKTEQTHMTKLVCEGLRLVLASRNNKKDQHGISDAETTHSPD